MSQIPKTFSNDEKHEIFRNLWIRLFARSFDNLIYFGVAALLVKLISISGLFPTFFDSKDPKEIGVSLVVLLLLFIFTSIFFEAYLIASFGATAGKKLLNFKILNANGNKLDYADAVFRSFVVFLRGCYLYIPVVSIIGFAAAADTIEKYGATYWDTKIGSKVVHRTPKLYGVVIIIGVFLALMIASKMGAPKPVE